MKPITIRTAGKEDVILIAELSRSTFHDTFHAQNLKEDMEMFLETNFSYDSVYDEISKASNTFLVANLGEDVAGYAKISENTLAKGLEDIETIEIARLYAVTDKIGSGVGKALMNECIKMAENKNKQIIWLGVWEHNLRAIAFYEKWGFEKFGEHEFMLGHDVQNDWLMKKELRKD